MSIAEGILYVVATPIGNLGDFSPRAQEVLAKVTRIAAEDTRHSAPLLRHFGITTPVIALHDHNERTRVPELIAALQAGESLALISDAGTPLISDPGFHLVRAARAAGVQVVPVPGPSALIGALSVAGLPTDRFVFEGFLPAKSAARRQRLRALASEPRTLVFYESCHRLVDTLADMAAVFGGARHAVLARELTKLYETVRDGSLDALHAFVTGDADQQKGEMVLVVAGAPESETQDDAEAQRVLQILVDTLPVKQAAELTARITGGKKNALYALALKLAKP